MFKPILVSCVFAAIAPALDAATTYKCDFSKRSGGGWVPKQALYLIDTETQSAKTYNTSSKSKDPVKTKFKKMWNNEYRMKWKVRGVESTRTRTVSGQVHSSFKTTVSPNYTVWLNPKTLKVKMRVNVGQSSKVIAGAGQCVINN